MTAKKIEVVIDAYFTQQREALDKLEKNIRQMATDPQVQSARLQTLQEDLEINFPPEMLKQRWL